MLNANFKSFLKQKDSNPIDTINVIGCKIEEMNSSENFFSFSISPKEGNRIYFLRAESQEKKDSWIKAIRSLSVDASSNRRNRVATSPPKLELNSKPISPDVDQSSENSRAKRPRKYLMAIFSSTEIPYNTNEKTSIGEAKFLQILKEIEVAPFRSNREDVLRTVCKNYFLTCEQLSQIISRLKLPEERISTINIVIPSISDKENRDVVLKSTSLEFDYERKTVELMFGK